MPRRPRRKAEDTREEILSTAEHLFGERGIGHCSIAHVAQALSMSPANVFKHFHSKIALVDAICQRKLDAMIRQIQTLDMNAPAPHRLEIAARRLMMAHIASLQDSPYMLEMVFLLSGEDLASGERYKTMIEELFLAVIRDGLEAGIYHCDNPVEMSQTVAAAFAAVLHPVFLAKQPLADLDRQCGNIVNLVNTALQNPLVK
ncbi:TetR family transcriptional regulator [Affinirhizobium pseudoryzae]|jgi:TetR/AcrR family transcriptional repressor of the ameABC operon|uniref:TetR family transcriptional regulator n=1 Tax=Allorhizobium pseudoryzae TaxID=379684 RepID=UPI0013EB671A|nr:TetR family transcriptional regulator [Allorhizobium pseudoryzae]